MIVLKVLYYLFPVIFIIGNFVMLFTTTNLLNFTKKVTLNKDLLDRDEDLAGKSCLILVYAITAMVWGITVLFTYNYEFALLYIPSMWIIAKVFYRSKNGASLGNMIYSKFSSLIGIVYYAFLIINSFHLHIQLGLFDYIKALF